jgi:hypothetical protein
VPSLTRSIAFALLLAALLPATAPGKPDLPQAASIDSISPAVADRGALVTITGNGFGAQNVRITVDGRPAKVMSATGSTATFRVPPLAGPGNTIVSATNPGGQTGTIALHIRFDGVSTPVLAGGAATATIGHGGGSLTAGSVTLTVPAGALSEDERITMTPLADLADSPLEGTLIGGVRLEPEGLRFLRPATLTMPLPAGGAAADILGFGSAGDGRELHLRPRTITGGIVALELWHFSTGGASSGGATAAAILQSHTPSSAEQQALQRITIAEAACVLEQAQGITGGPACANERPESVRALFDWYINAVRPGLQGAGNAPSFDAEVALVEWLAWQAEVARVFRNSAPPQCGTLQNECDQAHGLATTAVGAHAQRRLNNCTGTSLASQMRDVARMADFAGAGALDLTTLTPPLPDATNGDLLHDCAHLRIDVLDFPAIPALLHTNTLRGRVVTDVKNGADRTDVPFTLTVDGTLVGSAAGGSFQTTLTPTGAPLNATLEAEATNPALQITAFTAVEHLVRLQVRDRLQFQALSSTSVPAGGSITLRVRVAGDDMAGMAIVIGGPGTTNPSPLLTNGQGEATAVFTVLPGATQPNDVVTAVLPDGTSAGINITIAPNVIVSLSPNAVLLNAGAAQNFTASVFGSFLGVTWSTSGGGQIVTTGSLTARYEAGSTPGTFSVTATSISDPTRSATATVTIQAPASVEGLYIGDLCVKGFFQNDFSCIPNMQLAYQCSLESKVQPGRVCGWFASAGALQVPNMATFCQIETNGTSAGGAFTGRITFCRFAPPTARQAGAQINGSVGNGLLSFTLVATDPDGSVLEERFIGTKF